MTSTDIALPTLEDEARVRPVPIVALDVDSRRRAIALVESLPLADFFKVGLQLYTAAGPDIIRDLRARGLRIFLDLKLHDIPNTVAGAVRSAADLEVDLLTIHASGGTGMMRAASSAAADQGGSLRLLAVTVLTSLSAPDLAQAWGRDRADPATEAVRLARSALQTDIHGVVTSLQEAEAIRSAVGPGLAILTPGIRLPGDDPGDQARIGTPADAAALGVDYVVLGRTVTAAPDPAAAFERVRLGLAESR